MALHWRPMAPADLPAVVALAGQLHPDHPESPAVFAERLALAPEFCRVLAGAAGLAGYAVAHPWAGMAPPALDRLLGGLPARPDALHLHDIALAEAARGAGHAAAMVALLLDQAARRGLRRASLIAVAGKQGYWAGLGFLPRPGPADPALASYGPGACRMARRLAPPG